MPVQIKNTAIDRMKALQHRTKQGRFEYEPILGSTRIRVGQTITITDEHYARVKPLVDQWVKNGMVEVTGADPEPADTSKKVSKKSGKDDLEPSKPMAPIPAPVTFAEASKQNILSSNEGDVPTTDSPTATDTSESPKKGPGRKKLY